MLATLCAVAFSQGGPPTVDGVLKEINAIRREIGLQALVLDKRLDAAAEGHSRYMNLNKTVTHFQDKSREGLTAVAPWDRTQAAGVPGLCFEAISDDADLVRGVRRLFDAPNHRVGFLQPAPATGLAIQGRYLTIVFAAGTEGIGLSPTPSQKNVPTSWDGFDSPPPLPTHGVEPPVGYPIVFAGYTKLLSKITDVTMSRSTLYGVFSDPFYYGCYDYGGTFSQGNHLPMVSKEEFDRVRQIIDRPLKAQPQKHEFAFTGLIRCGICGCLITAERKVKFFPTTGTRTEYVYYHCTGRKGCPKDSIPESLIEERIAKLLSELTLTSDDTKAWSLAVVRRNHEARRRPETTRFNQERVALAKAKEHLDGLIEMRARNELSAEEFKERKERYGNELTRLTFDLQSAQEARIESTRVGVIPSILLRGFFGILAKGKSGLAGPSLGCWVSNTFSLLGRLEITVDPHLDVFRMFEPPKTSNDKVGSGMSGSMSPALRRRLDAIRNLIISGNLSFEKLPARNELDVEASLLNGENN